MANNTDQKTLDLIKEVNRRKEEIAKAEKPNWTTNCSFSYLEGSANVVNLHVCKDVREMINIAAFLVEKQKSYEEAVKMLGVVDPPDFKWCGFSVKDWIGDLKMRIGKVQIESKKKKLATLEERLNKIISPELRAQMELDAIAAELG